MPKDDKDRTLPEIPAGGGLLPTDPAQSFRLLNVVSMALAIFLVAFGFIRFIDHLALLRHDGADTAQALIGGLGYLVGGALSGAFVLLLVRCIGPLVSGRKGLGPSGQTTLIGGSVEDVLEAIEDLRVIVTNQGGPAPTAARPIVEAAPPKEPVPDTGRPALETPRAAPEPIVLDDEPAVPTAKPAEAAPVKSGAPPKGEPATFDSYCNTTRQYLKEGKVYEVSRLLDSIREKFGSEPMAREFIDDVRAQIDQNDKTNFEGLCGKVDKLIGKGHWLDAILLAEEVERKFPERPEVKDYALSIRRRRAEGAAGESRDHHRNTLRLVTEKKWEEAFTQAEEFLAMYPEDEKAAEVREMLEQIKSKLKRKQVAILSEYIKDAIQKKNYALAYKASMRLIQKFPDSKEARNVKAGLENLKRLSIGGHV